MATDKRYRLYVTARAFAGYTKKFVPKGEKERGVRGGVIYILRKFPVLYHAGLDEVRSALGVERLLVLVDRLAAEEEARLAATEADLMALQPHGKFTQAAADRLGMGAAVAELTPFCRVCLEINALSLVALDQRYLLPRIRPHGNVKPNDIQCGEKDFDLVFFERTFGKENLTNAMSLVAEHFWTWSGMELAAISAKADGARFLPQLTNKTTMQDSPLPGGDFAGDVLAHRLAFRAVASVEPQRRKECDEIVHWFAGLSSFGRAALELKLSAITPMKKLRGVNALLLPSTSDFFETYFGTPSTGTAFAAETFRSMFETELATDFIRQSFSGDELTLLRKLLRRNGLPKGEEVGLHLLNLLKREIDRQQLDQAPAEALSETVESYEQLLAKIAPLTLLQRMALSVYLLAH